MITRPLSRKWKDLSFPNLTETQLIDTIRDWTFGKPDRMFRYNQKIYFHKGPSLYFMSRVYSPLTKQLCIAHIDRHKSMRMGGTGPECRLFRLGHYARRAGPRSRELPEAWPVLAARIERGFNLRTSNKAIPCYSAIANRRPVNNAFHQRNAGAFDGLLSHLAGQMDRSFKHKSFYLNAQRKVFEEARLYEQLTGADLRIITRETFVLESFRDKVA